MKFDVLYSWSAGGSTENIERRMAGVQFHPVIPLTGSASSSTSYGRSLSAANMDDVKFIDEQVARIRDQVGDSRVICGLSGGDSAVAALVQRAVETN